MKSRLAPLALLAGLSLALAVGPLPAPPLPPATAGGLGDLEKYLLDDTTLVGFANFKAAKASPLFGKLKKEIQALTDTESFTKYLKQFGVRPLVDIERIALVMGEAKERTYDRNVKEEQPEDVRMYFLIQGKFDPAKFEAGFQALAKEHPEFKLHGTGLTGILSFERGDRTSLALADRNTLVFGPTKRILEEVQARAAGKTKAKFKVKDLPAGLKQLKSDSLVEAVAFGPAQVNSKFESTPNGFRITPTTLDQMGFSRYTVRVEAKGNDLTGKVVFSGKSAAELEAGAKKLTDGLAHITQEGDKATRNDPVEKTALAVMKSVKHSTAGQALTFEGKVTEAQARTLLEEMKREMDRMNERGKEMKKKG